MPKRGRGEIGKRAAAIGSDLPAAPIRYAAVLALLASMTCAAYLPAMTGRFVWDDDMHVTQPQLQTWDGLYRIWFKLGSTEQYYPLLHSAFWVEHRLWGDWPLGYHLANVLLHSLAAFLAYLILRRLNVPGALLAAAIFALHPVHVESVAWITEQKNTLSGVFYLAAMLVYLKFDETRQRGAYAGAVVLFVLALLSKTIVVTLPAAILVIFWWKRGTLSWRRDVVPLLPMFALSVIAGIFIAWFEVNYTGAAGLAFVRTPVERLLQASRAIWFYLGKLLWPTNLIFVYPRWTISAAIWWQWLYVAATLGMLVVLWVIRRRWRSPLAGWLFYVGTLLPMIGFFNQFLFMYTFVADHFQYLASLGIFALVAAGLVLVIRHMPRNVRWIGVGFCGLLLVVLGALTWQQATMYSDVVTLYRTILEHNPSAWMAHDNLGAMDLDAGRPLAAIDRFRTALELNPDYPKAHYNLGLALSRVGRTQEAIEQYRKAIDELPGYVDAHNNLGVALVSLGRFDEAIEQYQEALRLKDDYDIAHFNFGIALAKAGRAEEAIAQYKKAIEIRSDFPEAYQQLALVFSQLNRPEEAIGAGQKALEAAQLQHRAQLAEQMGQWLMSYYGQHPDVKPMPATGAPQGKR